MRLSVVLSLAVLASPALAADPVAKPKPVEQGSAVCTVDYNPNKPTIVAAHLGEQVGFQFGAGEEIEAGFATDTKNLVREGTADLVVFKAKANSGQQSILFRTHTVEGAEHTYPVLWTTLPDAPPPSDTRVASNGPVALPAKPQEEHYCLLVRWTYSAEERAKKAAAWRAQSQQAQSRRVEAALQHAAPPTPQNRSYSLQGDARLIPQVKQ